MARTHKVQREYIDRIIQVRRAIIPLLEKEVHKIAGKLGVGVFRSRDYSGLLVAVAEPQSSGRITSWKDVAWDLAEMYGIPTSEVMAVANKNTREPAPIQSAREGLRTTVRQDKAKNPKVVY